MSNKPSLIGRILGTAIGGGGAYAAIELGGLGLPMPAAIGIAGACAIAGFFLGPKVWEAVVNLL